MCSAAYFTATLRNPGRRYEVDGAAEVAGAELQRIGPGKDFGISDKIRVNYREFEFAIGHVDGYTVLQNKQPLALKCIGKA